MKACLLALLLSAGAAEASEVRDDFEGTATEWATGNFDTFSIRLEHGSLIITGRPDNKAAILLTARMPVGDEDFRVEAAMRHINGKQDEAFGIVFRAIDFDNRHAFLITADGRYSGGFFTGGYDNATGWLKSPAVRPGGSVNVIAAERIGGTYHFYVNGDHVSSVPTRATSGASIGFEVDGHQ